MTISEKNKKKIIEGVKTELLNVVRKAFQELSADNKDIFKRVDEDTSREIIVGENYPREEVLNERERCLLDKWAEYLGISTKEAEEIFISATKEALLTVTSEIQKDP
jgi:hypothetical protein